jgi:thiol-disulfide isomerase/thioredoxin
MKKIILTLGLLLALAGLPEGVLAGETSTNSIRADLMPIVAQIQGKLKAGLDTEADMAGGLKALDEVIARHRNDSKEDVAGVYLIKVQIYEQVLDNDDKALEALAVVQKDFAGTQAAQAAGEMAAQIKKGAAAKAIAKALAVGTKFPDFNEKDVTGQPLSVAGRKGKVVLVDFWATWCPPCRAELPNVIALYNKYHAQGFEVVGISLDQDRERLQSFTKAQGMAWPQYFDGLAWEGKLVKQYGVSGIPMTYLLDGQGMIIGKDLRGEELAAAVARGLAAK